VRTKAVGQMMRRGPLGWVAMAAALLVSTAEPAWADDVPGGRLTVVAQWLGEVGHYAVLPFLLQGAWVAIEIAALALTGGLVLGLCLAVLRLSPWRIVRGCAWTYVWFMRGTPLLLQLVFLYDALPAVGIRLDSFTTAVLGFGLNEAAFSAEFIRGGLLSVNRNQKIAAAALGMPAFLTLRRIVLPQAMRAILPAIANSAVNMIKGTSIASVIFVNELTFRSEQIVAQNFQFFTVLTAAGLIYLALTTVISSVQAALERHFDLDRERGGAGRFALPWRRGGTGEEPCTFPASAPGAGGLFEGIAIADKATREPSDVPCVVCSGARKSYGAHEVLRGIDLTVARGEVVVIIGPSGSGKSTLLRLINHLDQLDGGEIKVDGAYVGYDKVGGALRPRRDLARARAEARIGMVFQHFNLFDHLTALENVIEAPIHVYGEDAARARARGMRLLESVGLGQRWNLLPHRLSGGQQQRVAIARALAIAPRLMLFDEPTSALDPELVNEVLGAIRRLAHSGMTMIIVTHEIRFAREVADRIVFIDDGEIVEEGTPGKVLGDPEHDRTRRFLRIVEHA
jgi:polar amino acid transport system permease protein